MSSRAWQPTRCQPQPGCPSRLWHAPPSDGRKKLGIVLQQKKLRYNMSELAILASRYKKWTLSFDPTCFLTLWVSLIQIEQQMFEKDESEDVTWFLLSTSTFFRVFMAYNCCCWGSCFRTRVTWWSKIKIRKMLKSISRLFIFIKAFLSNALPRQRPPGQ